MSDIQRAIKLHDQINELIDDLPAASRDKAEQTARDYLNGYFDCSHDEVHILALTLDIMTVAKAMQP